MKKTELKIKNEKIIPPLTLSQKWHEVFESRKNTRLKSAERKLNEALKLQGKLTTEYRDYSLLKKKLMQDILDEMGDTEEAADAAKHKKMKAHKNHIEKLNQNLIHHEQRLTMLPKEIKGANDALLKESMAIGYGEIKKRMKDQKKAERKIAKHRKKLTNLIVSLDESKQYIETFYGFMHDIVGPEVIEEFDRIYLGGKMLD